MSWREPWIWIKNIWGGVEALLFPKFLPLCSLSGNLNGWFEFLMSKWWSFLWPRVGRWWFEPGVKPWEERAWDKQIPIRKTRQIYAKPLSHKEISVVKRMEEPGRITWKRWQVWGFLLKFIRCNEKQRKTILDVEVFHENDDFLNLLAIFSQNPRHLEKSIPPPSHCPLSCFLGIWL